MKSIVRKQHHQTNEAPALTPRRTSHEADRELAHLQKVLEIMSVSGGYSLPLSSSYWMARLRELRTRYALLPTQLTQVSVLERCVEGLVEQASRDDLRAKRVA